MRTLLNISNYLIIILSVLSMPSHAMNPEIEDTGNHPTHLASAKVEEIEINVAETEDASPKWEKYTHTLLGDEPRVVGCLQKSSFLIDVEQTLEDYSSLRGWSTWAWTKSMQARKWHGEDVAYPITDQNLAEMLCVASDYKGLRKLINYDPIFEGPFFGVHQCFMGEEGEENEAFSSSFKEKYPDVKEILLVAPNFPGGVKLIKNQGMSPLEKILQGKGILLKYDLEDLKAQEFKLF